MRRAGFLHAEILPSVYKGQHACQRLKSTLAASSSLVGVSPPVSSSLPAPVLSHWQVQGSFSGADLVAGQAFEAAGLSPGNENNAGSRRRCPEKPCCLLYTEGTVCCANRFAVSVRLLPHNAGKRTVFIPFACKQALLPCVFPSVRCCAPAEGARTSDIFPQNLAPRQRPFAWKARASKAYGFALYAV